MPFVSEEVWQKLRIRKNNNESIVYAQWPKEKKKNKNLLQSFSFLFKLISKIRKIRKEKGVPIKSHVELFLEEKLEDSQVQILQKMCFISNVNIVKGKVEDAFPFLLETNKYYLKLPFNIDKEEEKIRLQKELDYQKSFLKSVENKLSNENFLKNAPEKVLMLEKKKHEDALTKINSLTHQILSF